MARVLHVYILASESGVVYTGVTNDLVRRVWEHKAKRIPGFTKTYNVTKLVWFEAHGSARSAIDREKQIKSWRRARRIALVQATNPLWRDLSGKL